MACSAGSRTSSHNRLKSSTATILGMKLFVFMAEKTTAPMKTIITDGAHIIRLKVLLAGGTAVWTDTDDAAVPDTEAAIRATYMQPNGIPVKSMGRLGTGPRSWWVAVDRAAIRLADFYTVEEAVTADLFADDPAALAWKDHYIFLGPDGTDLIGTLDYLGAAKDPVAALLPKLLCA